MSYYIEKVDSGRNDVKKYKITIYQSSIFNPLYVYYRNSIYYDNGAWLPNYLTIDSEALSLSDSSSCGYTADYVNKLNVSVSNNKIDNLSSLSPKNSDILGGYVGSDVLVSKPFPSALFTEWHKYTEQKHNYQYGYVIETFKSITNSFYIDGDKFVKGVSNNGTTFYVDCKMLIIEYKITSLPKIKAKTTCCLLVCCEPDKYELQ